MQSTTTGTRRGASAAKPEASQSPCRRRPRAGRRNGCRHQGGGGWSRRRQELRPERRHCQERDVDNGVSGLSRQPYFAIRPWPWPRDSDVTRLASILGRYLGVTLHSHMRKVTTVPSHLFRIRKERRPTVDVAPTRRQRIDVNDDFLTSRFSLPWPPLVPHYSIRRGGDGEHQPSSRVQGSYPHYQTE